MCIAHREGSGRAHNPKVAGSNLAPAWRHAADGKQQPFGGVLAFCPVGVIVTVADVRMDIQGEASTPARRLLARLYGLQVVADSDAGA
jgi:hypothetical protein